MDLNYILLLDYMQLPQNSAVTSTFALHNGRSRSRSGSVQLPLLPVATSSKVKLEDMPILFPSAETSSVGLNIAHHVKCKEPDARCIRLSSPLGPVKQSKIDNTLFLKFSRQLPDLITNHRWLKISRIPGRNIHNESVFEGCGDADYSRLAVAYPPTHDGDRLFPKIKRFSPVRHARMNEDFFIKSTDT
ncbi:hypothetical protein JOM56_008124 [Amanita muscaria]